MPESKLYRQRNLQIVFAVTLMSVLGISTITPAFPQIIDAGIATKGQVGLLLTFFALPGIFIAPFLGVLADRLGRKKILVPSLFLFAITGTACAFAHDFELLLLLRVLQGAGAAALGSLNLTIIGDLYSGTQRAEAMGLNVSLLNIGTALYPTIGGALALLGWYYPFALPILAVPVGILVLTSLENPEPTSTQSMRTYLSGTWRYLKDIRVIGLFAAAVATFIFLFGSYLTYFPMLLDERFGASSFIIGIVMSSMSLTTAAVASQLGKINRKFSLGILIKGGFVIYALGMLLIAFIPNLWLLLIATVVFGLAHGTVLPGIMTSVASLAPLEHRGAFMSVNGAVLRSGQTIGPPLMGAAYALWALNGPFIAGAALALTAAIVGTLFGIKARQTDSPKGTN
ncbi:MAG: MFS transporter [Chloroflexota bacterium]